MSQHTPGKTRSFKSGAGSLSSARVVGLSAANTVTYWATSTSMIVGVTYDEAQQSDAAISVILDGTAKVTCFASVSAGAIVGPATDGSGKVRERTNPATTTTAFEKTIGMALEAGSTDSVIEVALQINNKASL